MADSVRLPRPRFTEDKEPKKKKCEVLFMGTNESGIVVKVYKDHMTINGYYEGNQEGSRLFANLHKPIKMAWEELEKAKQRAVLPAKLVAAMEPDYEDKPSPEYLASLPQVHINGMLFYIDGERKERRLVDRPSQVFCYFKKRKV